MRKIMFFAGCAVLFAATGVSAQGVPETVVYRTTPSLKHFSINDDRKWVLPAIREAIDGIAWHSYTGDPEAVKEYVRRFPELENIHTEMGPHIDRSKRDFLYWGELILRGFNAGQTGFTNWCLALDENGQPKECKT